MTAPASPEVRISLKIGASRCRWINHALLSAPNREMIDPRAVASIARGGCASASGRPESGGSDLPRRPTAPQRILAISRLRSGNTRGHSRRRLRDRSEQDRYLAATGDLRSLVLGDHPQSGARLAPPQAAGFETHRTTSTSTDATGRNSRDRRRASDNQACPDQIVGSRSTPAVAARGRGTDLQGNQQQTRCSFRSHPCAVPPSQAEIGGRI